MLEIKGLTKVYRPKRGVPVVAVDHLNLKFPDKGMVFLLGKSGSGKSTLLNLLGGLDQSDEGEIIIKGVSSSSFKQSHFDSYRNTYLGFIFQEYNVLEEFNVGANIALALELQSQKATNEAINRILEQVDLAGFGNRKPNELSGGQKQRVAIARALVKNPEIIMADEPTGALDSVTGRQVLDTLKKLSKEKLVIVVSHDREFAENYADRIIELADGHIISDMEYFDSASDNSAAAPSEPLVFGTDSITIAPAYQLTEEDRVAINRWLDTREGAKLTTPSADAQSSASSLCQRECKPTDESRIVSVATDAFRLIKSNLPMRNAFKIGANSLGHKKFRLVITVLLSCISFGLFGLSDTFGCYNHTVTCAKSIQDSNVTYASFIKMVRHTEDDYTYWDSSYGLSQKDLASIQADTNIEVTGVFRPRSWEESFDTQYDTTAKFTETDYHIYASYLSGYVFINEESLKALHADLIAGELPDGSKDEMAITTYLAQTFMIGGYREPNSTGAFTPIAKPEDLVGKVISYGNRDMKVTGIVDTHFDLDRYIPLTKESLDDTNADRFVSYALLSELNYARQYSILNMALVGEGYVERLQETCGKFYPLNAGDLVFEFSPDNYFGLNGIGCLSTNATKVQWLGEEKESLAPDEVILSESLLESLYEDASLYSSNHTIDLINLREAAEAHGLIHGQYHSYEAASFNPKDYNFKLVGILPKTDNCEDCAIVSDELFALLCKDSELLKDSIYNMAIGAMPSNFQDLKSLVAYSFREDSDMRYELANSVTFELNALNEVFHTLSTIFFWIGFGFAVFSSIMLANFIASSINYKKQEIGILRAIGARGSDVFRIFFSESFIIAMINFILSAVGTGIATFIINGLFRSRVGILVTILHFGARQVLLLFAISVGVAALSSFFPVWRIARKHPIDAIRNR